MKRNKASASVDGEVFFAKVIEAFSTDGNLVT